LSQWVALDHKEAQRLSLSLVIGDARASGAEYEEFPAIYGIRPSQENVVTGMHEVLMAMQCNAEMIAGEPRLQAA
jgi:hypothetical protein